MHSRSLIIRSLYVNASCNIRQWWMPFNGEIRSLTPKSSKKNAATSTLFSLCFIDWRGEGAHLLHKYVLFALTLVIEPHSVPPLLSRFCFLYTAHCLNSFISPASFNHCFTSPASPHSPFAGITELQKWMQHWVVRQTKRWGWAKPTHPLRQHKCNAMMPLKHLSSG